MASFAIDRALLHTDGGSRGNPGISGIGFTLDVDDGRELATICRGGAYVGIATNNVAEYRALIWGLRNARGLRVRKLDVYADSELLVKQLLGTYRVKNEGIKPLFAEARQLLEGFESYTISHVPREMNSAADELANKAMDSRGMVGDYVTGYEAGDLFSAVDVAAGRAAAFADDAEEDADEDADEGDGGCQGDETADMDSSPWNHPGASRHPSEGGELAPCSPDNRGDRQKGPFMTDTTSGGVYTLTIKEHFDAAHALIGYPGQCQNLHGHTWDVEVSVRGSELDEVGIVYDFKDLKDNLMDILERYDHGYLNEIPPFDAMNATAENLARVIYEQMAALLPEGIELVEVSVWESPIARLTYTR
jgi:6-pyruvoyltetrahydropterin/6-carboxytetrahydropterin synthase